MQVKDSNGNDVKGIIRNPDGSLISIDKNAYSNYMRIRDSKLNEKKKIESLEREIYELKQLINKLIN